MSSSGRSSSQGRLVSATAARSSSGLSAFVGRPDVAGAVASSVGNSMPAVFARMYHHKTDLVPRKLTKQRPSSDLKASISAPLPSQLTRSPPASGLAQRRTPISRPNQVRPAHIPSDGHGPNTVARRPNVSSPCALPSAQQQRQRIDQHKAVGIKTPTKDDSQPLPPLPTTQPRWPWGPHPNPLRSNPPLAVTADQPVRPARIAPVPNPALAVSVGKPARPARCTKLMGRRYAQRLSKMAILPTLAESTGENVASSNLPPVGRTLAVLNSTAAMLTPPPRPAPPVYLANVQRSQSQQLQARNALIETANGLRADNAQLHLQLQEAVTQRIVAAAQLVQARKDNLALEKSLQALREQVARLSHENESAKPHPAPSTAPDCAALKQKLAQQTQQLAFHMRSDSASRQMADALVDENRHMKQRLHKAEAERARMQTSLDVAEGKVERMERSLYVYPAPAAQQMRAQR